VINSLAFKFFLTETADLVSALSEAAHRRHPFMQRVELLRRFSRKKSFPILRRPVATSSSGLGFRSFSTVPSNSIPPASSSLFLPEDNLPPSNQLEVSQIVPKTMLPSRPGAMILPNTLQVNTAYSLLRTLCNFCCENPGVLGTTSVLVQLPPVGDAQSPYQVPPPPPVWPVPQFPLRELSLTRDLRCE
jgi:hypothetical protein